MSISTESELLGMQKVSGAVASTLKEMIKYTRIGMTTRELDLFGAKILADYGAKSAPYLTYNFPGYTCISVNNEICHGIPSDKKILKDGDLINIDVSAELNGFWSDNGASFVLGNDIHQHQKLGLLIISHDMHEIACHLDAFIHFSSTGVHFCETIECVKEDSYVGV